MSRLGALKALIKVEEVRLGRLAAVMMDDLKVRTDFSRSETELYSSGGYLHTLKQKLYRAF